MKLGLLLGRIAHHSLVYGAGELLGRMSGILLVPLFTRALNVEAFGQYQVLLTFQSLGLMVLGMGQAGTLMRYHTLAPDAASKREVVAGAALLVALANVAIVIAVFFLAPWASHRFLGDPELAVLVRWMWIGVLLRVLSEIPMTLFRLEERSDRFALANLLRLGLALALVIYLVVVRKLGLLGAILADTIAAAAFFLALAGGFSRNLGRIPNRRVLAEYLRFGWPYITSNLGAFALLSIDKLFLAAYGMVSLSGIYALAGKLGVLINAGILSPFTLVFGPMMFRIAREHTESEAKRLFAGLLTWFALLLFWAALALIVFAREILGLAAPPSYGAALAVAAPLIVCYVIYGFYKHLQVGLAVTGRTGGIASAFVLAAIVNVVGNAVLIPRFEMMGAAIATLFAYLTMAIVVGILAHRAYPISYAWGRIALAGLLAGTLTGAALVPPSWPLTLALPLKLAAVMLYPLLLLSVGFLRPSERLELARRCRELWSRRPFRETIGSNEDIP